MKPITFIFMFYIFSSILCLRAQTPLRIDNFGYVWFETQAQFQGSINNYSFYSGKGDFKVYASEGWNTDGHIKFTADPPANNVGFKFTTRGNDADVLAVTINPDGSTKFGNYICGSSTSNSLRIQTTKYVDIGAQNSNHVHFYTNASQGYYFNKELLIGGGRVCSYQTDLVFYTNTSQRMVIDDANGNCGIGNNYYPDVAFKLDVNGDIATNHVKINSDIRLKKDLDEVSDSKIKNIYSLQAWTYRMNQPKKLTNSYGFMESDSAMIEISDPVDTSLNIGFVAQEVRELFPELVTERENGYLTIDYISIIPLLVEALKEQNSKIEELELMIKLKSGRDDKSSDSNSTLTESSNLASLGNNIPNPFINETDIPFYISESVNRALINVYDLNGKLIKSYPVHERNNGILTISGYEFMPGMYHYALVIDNNLISTKTMIINE